LKYNRVGNSGLKISEFSLGTWVLYRNKNEYDRAIPIIDKAFELGINCFDTADVYSGGAAETELAKAIRRFPRSACILSTKLCMPTGEGPNDRGLSRKHILEQVHTSLRRLNVEYIDILYCHRFDEETPLYETMRTFNDLIRQGKVLYLGISNWTAEQIGQALRVSDTLGLERIIANQPKYNLLDRRIELEAMPLCAREGISQVVYSPLEQGILTGKYLDAVPQGSRAADPAKNQAIMRILNERILEKTSRLKRVADDIGAPLSHLALAWVLRERNVASAILGASSPLQLEENIKAAELTLSDDVLKRINDICPAGGGIG
jgi:aryl-alcohol dehydrogenase-like predicted oxidoreductase